MILMASAPKASEVWLPGRFPQLADHGSSLIRNTHGDILAGC
jgi:hypothetical protein